MRGTMLRRATATALAVAVGLAYAQEDYGKPGGPV